MTKETTVVPNLDLSKIDFISDIIFLFVGKSGSGKTTIAKLLERYGLSSVESYTTRSPRYEGEKGHIFVTESDIPPKSEMVAYTFYNGYHYWATQQQVEENNIYIIDPKGVEFFLENYTGNKKVVIVEITATLLNRFIRMLDRGDGVVKAISRIVTDKREFKLIHEIVNVTIDNNSPWINTLKIVSNLLNEFNIGGNMD